MPLKHITPCTYFPSIFLLFFQKLSSYSQKFSPLALVNDLLPIGTPMGMDTRKKERKKKFV
jgi:hypothetical protein